MSGRLLHKVDANPNTFSTVSYNDGDLWGFGRSGGAAMLDGRIYGDGDSRGSGNIRGTLLGNGFPTSEGYDNVCGEGLANGVTFVDSYGEGDTLGSGYCRGNGDGHIEGAVLSTEYTDDD